ncbi:ABC transporter ATP-binding protein (plasmid) [Agrobacterium rosae]|uniref:ABC transporter ATP-binding protein n=1 Tax=Agrobacterium rosae TaxID=1972867 RepID=A0AAW9FQJ7_9HYPH|nr:MULTISPECIES: ABC transporter ATP-binding protein [Agrobacterium]MDX8321407.1 ABC transporter ATP-binding protein [Agrobacterium sp. rho-8.1]MDX8305125.1 ABC transporter ATP-binding protein [Agrobacterium rosae]MDX8310947.1 ABC transporter ATP-binding protein [Agrobacterium sp. rho-13.3]MDX8316154.1 ABC transporter ATP-binding protein [Agrobacterium rosae]MDX8327215.1 ABC transporter ATP-binding protein [Agrobacterium tumefaciens]
MAEVILNNITKSFADHRALDEVSMVIPDGSFVVLLGPTGAGKTTTLRMVSGLDTPDNGEILIGGRSMRGLTPAQRNVAMVFQQYSLYPHLSVRQNLEFPLKSPLLKTPQNIIDEKVNAIAEILQISHKLDNKATALSGGEMQRVSIGRALVRNPQIYLMDEPLSSLDAKLRADLRIELKKIQAKSGATLLYVTHDQVEAMTMATHVGVLHEGRLVQFGPPRDIYEQPVSIYAATRLGQPRINIVPAELFPGVPAKAKSLGLRPEHIDQGDGQDATVTRVEHLGDQTRLHLLFRTHNLITVTDAHTELKGGETIKIQPNKPLYFDAAGMRLV